MTSSARAAATGALIAVGLLSMGCAKDEHPASTTTTTDARDRSVRFAECMREHGVDAFPDPDASGDFTVDEVLNGTSIDASSPAWKGAIRACRTLQPAGFTGRKRSTSEQSGALRFAACVRAHGVEDFPDPAAGEPLIDTNRIPSANRPGGMAILNAATKQCRSEAADAGVTG